MAKITRQLECSISDVEEAKCISKIRSILDENKYNTDTQLTIIRDVYTIIRDEFLYNTASKFKVGHKVWFVAKGKKVHAVITKINQKSVSVMTVDPPECIPSNLMTPSGIKWNVSPPLLNHYEIDDK